MRRYIQTQLLIRVRVTGGKDGKHLSMSWKKAGWAGALFELHEWLFGSAPGVEGCPFPDDEDGRKIYAGARAIAAVFAKATKAILSNTNAELRDGLRSYAAEAITLIGAIARMLGKRVITPTFQASEAYPLFRIRTAVRCCVLSGFGLI